MKKLRAAVFLDRDGVINEDRADYVKSWEEFRFIRGVRPALARLKAAGLPVVIVSNQSAVGRGLISRETLEGIHQKMTREIEKAGGALTGIYFCPHRPEEGCRCRKPRAGLLHRAAKELGIDLSRSLFVGDTGRDLEAGRSAGCRTMLVLTGQGQRTLKEIISAEKKQENLYICLNLLRATDLIPGLVK